jgi:hypothetical protein
MGSYEKGVNMSQQQNPPNPNTNQTLVEVFTTFFRAVARPAVTIIFAAVIAQAVVQGIDVPQWFLGLAIPVISWWFAERAVTHVKEKKEQD